MARRSTPSKSPSATKPAGKATAERQRAIQNEAMERNSRRGTPPKKQPVQAGTRKQPANPMPAQHLRKPGLEKDLDLAPRYLAPDYVGSGKLEGHVAVITGGDSGIGRAVAVLFAREGADVAILYLDEHDDAKVTCAAIEKEGRRSLAMAGDVKSSAFCDAAVARVIERWGRIDVLVNNAAFQQHCTSIVDLSDEHIDETLRTNIAGYFHMARAAIPHMARGGSIINTGSETGIFGSAGLLDYSATKGAIHAFTMSLASQLLPKGIRVNAVAPGPVWTPLNPADRDAKDVATFGQDSDMARPAQPEEISPAYVFLAAPVCASYVNGVILPVMGGPRG